jgi:hypothetical protein
MTKTKMKPEVLVAHALRSYAERMMVAPEFFSPEEGRALDRALRSCKGITDVDRIWYQWEAVANEYEWNTVLEFHYNNGYYPDPYTKGDEWFTKASKSKTIRKKKPSTCQR